jgi:hypothetical protein
MGESDDTPPTPPQRQTEEFEDPHYHDDELPADDGRPATPWPPGRRRLAPRRPRRFEDD